MSEDVWIYFKNEYEKCSFSVVPGHWPDFKSCAEVDRWIEVIEEILQQ